MSRRRKTDIAVEGAEEITVDAVTESTIEAAVETAPDVEREATAHVWVCPGLVCKARWVGAEGSMGYKAYRAHVARHSHAKDVPQRYDPATATADEERRGKLV